MTTNEIAAISGKRMRGVMTPAASLVMISLLVFLGSLLSVKACKLFVSSLLFESSTQTDEFFPVCAVIGIIELLLLCFPLYLNMKRWIVLLDNGFLPLRCAFSYFSSFTEYKKAFCFTSFRALALFASVFICFLPSSLLLTILSKLSPESGLWLIVCFVLSAVLFLLGCFFCYYLIAGMFLSDYLFIEGQVSSPLKAIRLSFSMMHGHRFRLLCVIGYRIPYLLLSVFIVSLPLTLPIIESTFAVLAHDILLTHQSEIDATIQ